MAGTRKFLVAVRTPRLRVDIIINWIREEISGPAEESKLFKEGSEALNNKTLMYVYGTLWLGPW